MRVFLPARSVQRPQKHLLFVAVIYRHMDFKPVAANYIFCVLHVLHWIFRNCEFHFLFFASVPELIVHFMDCLAVGADSQYGVWETQSRKFYVFFYVFVEYSFSAGQVYGFNFRFKTSLG
jgi:hypothetical protein